MPVNSELLISNECGYYILLQERKLTLTLEDLAPALSEFGITIKKPSYYT